MEKKYIYKIIVQGKMTEYEGHEKSTPEGMVRCIMCWYMTDTIFVVIDPSYNISIFQKVASPDPIKGYSELVNYIEKLKSE